jgi:SpoVK/Ycf46/Vps4 family AAA+-type ATPase
MLQIVTELDGFDARGNIKVLMATNRPDTLDPALLRPGRLDRKVEFGLPDLEGRTHILKIHAKVMSVDRDIRYEVPTQFFPIFLIQFILFRYFYPLKTLISSLLAFVQIQLELNYDQFALRQECFLYELEGRVCLKKIFLIRSTK